MHLAPNRPEVSELSPDLSSDSTAAPRAEMLNAGVPRVNFDGRLRGKHVGMVTFSFYPGDPRPRRAVEAFLKEGASVDLLCVGDESTPGRETLGSLDVSRLPVRNRRGGKISYAYQYAAFILMSSAIFGLRSVRRRYDLVYVNNMPDILVVSALMPKMLGAKVILDLHDPMPELMITIFKASKDGLSVRLVRLLEKWSMARANFVLTVNTACKKIFASRSCPAEKIGVVMNAPDSDIFSFRAPSPRTPEITATRRPFVIMYHGSLVERNGLDLAVDALSQVRQVVPSVELRIYGKSTPFLERVMKAAKDKGLHDAVRYLGPKRLEDLVPEISDCDLGIIPNHRNAFTEINTPTRIFEYLALGKPVVAPRTPGIQDYFTDGSLFFFESGDAADLARKIEYAYSHPAEAMATAERGQEVYLAHTWQQERETLVGLVAKLLSPRETN
ncbi:MAG TPA: glycosyltransferase family 4 protein [Candidatus Dormibacteraeota bacterium]|nr:glycosyltransferase family 4 protein [Candidatus Dormibacteraeota bacterium]